MACSGSRTAPAEARVRPLCHLITRSTMSYAGVSIQRPNGGCGAKSFITSVYYQPSFLPFLPFGRCLDFVQQHGSMAGVVSVFVCAFHCYLSNRHATQAEGLEDGCEGWNQCEGLLEA
jgi:hypothetical protein